MDAPTLEDQGEGQGHSKRQRCNDGVPISTRYETSTITTYYVSYSYYTPPSHSSERPETTRPAPTSWVHYTLKTPRPFITIKPEPSTTYVPPRKSVVSSSDIIPKARAVNGVPITITRTIVTRVPVETVYSCPPSPSREPSVSWSSRSWRSTSTEAPSTRQYPSSSTPSTRHRPTAPPSTSPPPSTRSTSTIPPPTSSAPNSTRTWPPVTRSYSECVYTLFDGEFSYRHTASCSSTTSQSLCTRFYRNGEWGLVPCTSSYTNTSSTTSTLTDTTTSTQTITSWPCSSYVPSRETWVDVPCASSINTTWSSWPCTSYELSGEGWIPVPCTSTMSNTTTVTTTWPCTSYVLSGEVWIPTPCTSTMPNTTTSTVEQCSTFLGSRSGWAIAPCTSTSNITSTPTTPSVIITPTHSRSCSTFVEDLKTWLPIPCNTITTTPTIRTISIPITHNITQTPTITDTPTITETPTITGPTTSHTRRCSTYISELEIWVSVPCNTPTPTRSMCLNDDGDMWVPCTSTTRTSDTDTLSETITETSATIPIFFTVTRTPHTRPSTRPHLQTFFPSATSIESEGPTLTEGPTQTSKTETHTPSHSQVTLPSSNASLGTPTGRHPTSRVDLSSSREVLPSSTRGAESPTTHVEHSSTRVATTRDATTRPVPHSTRSTSRSTTTRPTTTLPQSPPSSVTFTSNFVPPSSGSFSTPSATSIMTTIPGGIQGGALAGVIVGSILGAIGLLGLGAFLMKAFGGHRGRDLFAPSGGYEAAPGGSTGGRDSGGGGGGGSGGMSEARNETPLRSALRNGNMTGGGEWRDASWSPTYAYTGIAAAAAVAATSTNNQRGRDSETHGRYANGGIRDEDTPDAVPQQYGDGGLAGPDSHYDTGISNHPYGNQDIRYIVSNSQVQFDPYRDLPVHQDPVPVGGNITRESAYTTPEFLVSPPGPTSTYHSTAGNIASSYPGSTLQPPQADSGVFMSAAGGLSTTSFAGSSIGQGLQSQTQGSQYQSLPPYGQNMGGVGMYQSPEPLGSTDIQRPPYWEGSAQATSVDSLPQHANIPRYSAFTDVGSAIGFGSSSAPGFDNTLGVGSAQTQSLAPAPVPGIASMLAVESSPQVNVASPTWNPVGVTEFGQNVVGSSSAQPDATTCISGSDAPDGPKGLHLALTRLTTELASVEGRDIDSSSPRSASQVSVRPPKVGGPRVRPPRNPARLSIPRPDSARSLPPAYEEHTNT
ncbi:unnamed protein product [Rhizoctonia solani]|uniref:Uncharacterized protein n=1 Tax=Rhizoctonia solani TaxID=456999 RepID=A0A8H3AE89_9AGAM|nr:unnamed protein product [Rhizoctonia solani]